MLTVLVVTPKAPQVWSELLLAHWCRGERHVGAGLTAVAALLLAALAVGGVPGLHHTATSLWLHERPGADVCMRHLVQGTWEEIER